MASRAPVSTKTKALEPLMHHWGVNHLALQSHLVCVGGCVFELLSTLFGMADLC